MLEYYPDLRLIFFEQIKRVLPLVLPGGEATASPPVLPKRINLGESLGYGSAIALQLTKHNPSTAASLAQALVDALNRSITAAQIHPESSLSQQVWRDCTVAVVPANLIQIQVGDRALTHWLQYLGQADWQFPTLPQSCAKTDLLLVQLTHARCCSLLYTAEREGLIQLSSNLNTHIRIHHPQPLPWLTPEGRSHLQHPAEHSLIRQLLTLLEQLNQPQPAQPERYAIALSQSFQVFDAACRILGDTPPALAQARLGLIGATQAVLQRSLEDVLAVSAPRRV